jgi:hypothetical protein
MGFSRLAGGVPMIATYRPPVIVPTDGAHLTHLLARYKAAGMVAASREQDRRRGAWATLVKGRAR